MESMSHQIRKYEVLVKQLKDELREEKSKANEEADDLAQEMAELRYQMTGLLEEECKRRACIEQASLQRISELEAQGSGLSHVFVMPNSMGGVPANATMAMPSAVQTANSDQLNLHSTVSQETCQYLSVTRTF
uniref:Uncharacterized protein n=1 Tax=Salix viminalis TaxID=40686 RepID=A0A6N2KTJ6_SALVM